MINVLMSTLNELFFYSTTLPASNTYEYWLLLTCASIIAVACLYAPFAIARWFFRGLGH